MAGEGGGIPGQDTDPGIAPDAHILPQDFAASPHHLVGNQREGFVAEFPQAGGQVGGLPAGSRTQVQHHPHVGSCRPAEQFAYEHRRGILHIIAAGMEQRIHRERRALGQQPTIGTPGNKGSALKRTISDFQRVETDRHGRIPAQGIQDDAGLFLADSLRQKRNEIRTKHACP